MRLRTLSTAAAAVTVALGAMAVPAHAAPAKRPALPGDFNGDGYREAVSAAPNATVGAHRAAGLVAIVYGGKQGASVKRRQILTQASAGVPGDPSGDAYFGAATASADFDRDGYADLAVAAGVDRAAGVIVYGGPKGLSARTAALAGPGYTRHMVTGDFDGDGKADLAAVTGDTVLLFRGVGARPGAPQVIKVARPKGESARLFPVAADFTGDRRTDLVLLGTATTDGETVATWGELRTGTAQGLGGRQVFASGGVGEAGAAGDVNGDGKADLVHQRDLGDDPKPGSFAVRLGGAKGFGAARNYTQDTKGVPGRGAKGDGFGQALAVGDVDRDGKADVAVGAPAATVGKARHAGTVTVLYGAKGGLGTARAQLLSQDAKGVPGAAEKDDQFGRAVSFTDANGDGKADLLAGAPYENNGEGRLYVFPGTRAGVAVKGLVEAGPATLGVTAQGAQLGSDLLR